MPEAWQGGSWGSNHPGHSFLELVCHWPLMRSQKARETRMKLVHISLQGHRAWGEGWPWTWKGTQRPLGTRLIPPQMIYSSQEGRKGAGLKVRRLPPSLPSPQFPHLLKDTSDSFPYLPSYILISTCRAEGTDQGVLGMNKAMG